jgi:hypothetical protein
MLLPVTYTNIRTCNAFGRWHSEKWVHCQSRHLCQTLLIRHLDIRTTKKTTKRLIVKRNANSWANALRQHPKLTYHRWKLVLQRVLKWNDKCPNLNSHSNSHSLNSSWPSYESFLCRNHRIIYLLPFSNQRLYTYTKRCDFNHTWSDMKFLEIFGFSNATFLWRINCAC